MTCDLIRTILPLLLPLLLSGRVYSAFTCQEVASDLQRWEVKVFSQNGEDGITLALLGLLGVTPQRFSVEFGVENGDQCNTRILRQSLLNFNFTTIVWDGGYENPEINLFREFITHSNIVDLLEKYSVPKTFDLLSIDLDSIDWWVLLQIFRAGYKPRIIIVEVNPTLGLDGDQYTHAQFARVNNLPLAVDHPYSLQFAETVYQTNPHNGETRNLLYMDWGKWSGTNYYGANPAAFRKLGHLFGYEMVYCERAGVNCFLVERDALKSICTMPDERFHAHDPADAREQHTITAAARRADQHQRDYHDRGAGDGGAGDDERFAGSSTTSIGDAALPPNTSSSSISSRSSDQYHLPLPFIPIPLYGPNRMGHGRDARRFRPILVTDELLRHAAAITTPKTTYNDGSKSNAAAAAGNQRAGIHATHVEKFRVVPLITVPPNDKNRVARTHTHTHART